MAAKRTVQHDAHIDDCGREDSSFPSCSIHVNLVDSCLMGPGMAPRAVTSIPLSPLHHFLFAKPVEIQVALIHSAGLFLMMNASLGSRGIPQFSPIKSISLLRVF